MYGKLKVINTFSSCQSVVMVLWENFNPFSRCMDTTYQVPPFTLLGTQKSLHEYVSTVHLLFPKYVVLLLVGSFDFVGKMDFIKLTVQIFIQVLPVTKNLAITASFSSTQNVLHEVVSIWNELLKTRFDRTVKPTTVLYFKN